MTTVYPGAHTDRIENTDRRIAELERRVRDLEYAIISAAGHALVGASLCDATVIDYQGTHSDGVTGHPLPNDASEPPLADRGESAPSRVKMKINLDDPETRAIWESAKGSPSTFVCARCLTTSAPHEGCKCGQDATEPFFRPGDRCAVFTGGDPCVKPGTVEAREHDGRWLVKIDRAGKIRATEEEMCFLPSEWK